MATSPKKKKSGPSTRNLAALPTPARLRALTQSLALLDEILFPDWEGRLYSFDPAWAEGEAMASMRDGTGNTWFLWFGAPGLVLLGFDHEASPMTPYARDDRSLWPGMLDGFPKELAGALKEPAFSPGDFTFVIWRRVKDDRYHVGPIEFPKRKAIEPFASDPDGSAWLLEILGDDPKTYVREASAHCELEVPLAAVKKVYARATIDEALVATLNEEADFDEVRESARAMGFEVG